VDHHDDQSDHYEAPFDAQNEHSRYHHGQVLVMLSFFKILNYLNFLIYLKHKYIYIDNPSLWKLNLALYVIIPKYDCC
jgi:hypothetical protein